MASSATVTALIPARAGSVRVKDKNIRPLAGHPLLAYAIASARASGVFETVLVSTDSPAYAEIARWYGAEAMMRPAEMAAATSPDIQWVTHALTALADRGETRDAFSILRPTSPFRGVQTIRRAWRSFLAAEGADSLRAVEPVGQHPGKMWRLDGDRLRPLLDQPVEGQPWHSRQMADLPLIHVQNASLEIAWTRMALDSGTIAGTEIAAFLTEGCEGLDINTEKDWWWAERLIAAGEARLPDIDIAPYPGADRVGDLIGAAVEGELYFLAKPQFDRVRALNAARAEVTALVADMARLNALYMIATAGSGHIGSSFSSMELFAHLEFNEIDRARGDLFFSSKGHDAPGLYAVMMASGRTDPEQIHLLRRLDGLPGHPDIATPGMVTNTGSLGMGVSKAKGMVLAARLAGRRIKAVVITGDGELQEGQNWEALISAANWKMGELVVVVDHNRIQSDYSVERTSSLGDLEAKFAAFGWQVERLDGHDPAAIAEAFARLERIEDRPKVIIADTVKGRGVSFMEGTSVDSDVEMFLFHSGAPRAADYTRAAQELLDRINHKLAGLGAAAVEVERVDRPATPAAGGPAPKALFPAYAEALLAAAGRRPDLVALDADLVKDMGLVAFAERFPDRLFECGIAEQDMVSMAGGMALKGLLPVVHSFSCFLAARPNEQIYNNATERTKVVYVGGLSGVLPAGPGHSHQSVREISAVGGIPNLVMAAPSCPAAVAPLLDWCLEVHHGPSFLRLASLPVELDYDWPAGAMPAVGCGVVLCEGDDVVLIGSGPVLLAQAVKASRALAAEGLGVRVIDLPWLNRVDARWLADAIGERRLVVTLDDHYVAGGQGEKVLAAMVRAGLCAPALELGLWDVPPCGQPAEVLARLGLDAAGIARSIQAAFD